MRWETRITIVVGLLCVLSAAWYFRVFRPARLHQGVAVDFSRPPSVSAQLPPLPAEPAPAKPIKPTRRVVAPPRPEAPPAEPKPEPAIIEPAPEVVEPPSPEPAPEVVEPPPPEPPPAPPEPRYYVVKSGDSLWRIAKAQLGDAARHEELYELNAEALNHNPDNLRLGQKLLLPPK